MRQGASSLRLQQAFVVALLSVLSISAGGQQPAPASSRIFIVDVDDVATELTPFRPLATLDLPLKHPDQDPGKIFGVTIGVVYRDCFSSLRWSPPSPQLLVGQPPLDIVVDHATCSVFIRDAPSGAALTSGTFQRFSLAMRNTVLIFNRPLSPTEISPPSSPVGSGVVRLQLYWMFWTDVTRPRPIRLGEPEVAFHCPDANEPRRIFDAAIQRCAPWLTVEFEPASGGVIAGPVNDRADVLLDYLRRSDDRAAEGGAGYVTYIGLRGTSDTWFSGARVNDFSNFERGSPEGAESATVMLDSRKWQSRLGTEAHAFCCQTFGAGSLERAVTGRVSLTVLPATADSPLSSLARLNHSAVMKYDADRFRPFATVDMGDEALYIGMVAWGVTLAVHPEDCSSRPVFRFVPPFVSNATFNVTYDLELCHLSIALAQSASSASSQRALNVTSWFDILRDVVLITTSDAERPTSASPPSPPLKLLWNAWSDDRSPRLLSGSVSAAGYLPSAYRCASSTLMTAAKAEQSCGEWGVGDIASVGSGFLVTIGSANEQRLVEAVRLRASLNTDAWIGLDTTFNGKWKTGEALVYRNWAPSEPQWKKRPAVLSADSGAWRTVLSPLLSSYGVCCERVLAPSVSLAGAATVSIVPGGDAIGYGSANSPEPPPLAASYVHTRAANLIFGRMPSFQRLLLPLTLAVAADAKIVYGVTIALDPMMCGTHDASPQWQLASSTAATAARVSLCGHSTAATSPQCDAKTAEALNKRCQMWLLRDDGSGLPWAQWQGLLGGVSIRRRVAMGPLESFLVMYTAWLASEFAQPWFGYSRTSLYRCEGAGNLRTFVDAQTYCRSWHGDAFLVADRDDEEHDLIAVARNATVSAGIPIVWLGHQFNAARWLSGDPVDPTTTRWDVGQPDLTGPTALQANDRWRNVLGRWVWSAQRYTTCCSRRAAHGQTAFPFTGRVLVTGTTRSTSVSLTAPSRSSSLLTSSRSVATRTRPVRIPTQSPSRLTMSSTGSRTRVRNSRSTAVTPSHATRSMSVSRSFFGSRSPSFSGTRVRLPPVEMDVPEDFDAEGDAVRGVLPEFSDPGKRTVYIRIQNAWFRSDPALLFQFVKLTPQRITFYGFSAFSGTMITPDSFSANLTHLWIRFQLESRFDVANNELINVDIDRRATTMLENDLPATLPRVVVRILHGGETTALADVAMTFASVVAVVGSISAIKDQQIAAIIGTTKCARGQGRAVFRSVGRIISPLRFGDELYSPWLGTFVPAFGFVWLHLALLAVTLPSIRQRITLKRLAPHLARWRFPSISVLVVALLYLGTAFYSIELFKVTREPVWLAMGSWGSLFVVSVLGLVAFWSFADRSMTFTTYDASDFLGVPSAAQWIVPFGRWGPEHARVMTGFLVGDFRVKQYTWLEFFLGIVVALIAAYMPPDMDMCATQYAVMGAVFGVNALATIGLRPFRSHFANVSSVVSHLLLCLFLVTTSRLVNDPFGAFYTPTNGVRWAFTGLTALRGIVGAVIRFLEYKLVSTRIAAVEQERKRQSQALAVSSVLDDEAFAETLSPSTSESNKRNRKGRSRRSPREKGAGSPAGGLLTAPLISTVTTPPSKYAAGINSPSPATGVRPGKGRKASKGHGSSDDSSGDEGKTTPRRRGGATPSDMQSTVVVDHMTPASRNVGASAPPLVTPQRAANPLDSVFTFETMGPRPGATIFTPVAPASSEQDRRQRILDLLHHDTHPSAGHTTAQVAGGRTLPKWL